MKFKVYKAFFSILEPEVPLYEVDATKPEEKVLEEVSGILGRLTENKLL